MLERLRSLPLFVLLMGAGAMGMFLPAVQAILVDDHHVARAFFYSAILFLILAALIAIATSNVKPSSLARSQLLALLAGFAVLPIMLAYPFYEALRTTTFSKAWFEMVSSLTTTGATVYEPERLTDAMHLWRGMVGWFGGFLVWVMAVAIFAPMNLGGFEVRSESTIGAGTRRFAQIEKTVGPSERLIRLATKLAPIYVGLTAVLWLSLIMVGERSLYAAIHAMSTLATSGISPVGNLSETGAGTPGELLIFAFLFFALSRLTFSRGLLGEDRDGFQNDPEFRIGLALVAAVSAVFFLRQWIGSFEVGANEDLGAAASALWGSLFTVMSFLTTTGFESAHWDTLRNWSGLQTPGLALLGLALIGGGIATTAGGVKLLRVYALFTHGRREVERLISPSSVGGAGRDARRIRKEGAYIAWIFFMLFAISIAGVMLALALTGVQFETAMVLSIAALSTTGPLAEIAAEVPIAYAGLPDTARTILAFAMVLGRLEALAIIALLNPDVWRS